MPGAQLIAIEMVGKEAAWQILPAIVADIRTGEILYCSDYAAAIFGYTVDELRLQPVETLVPEPLRHQHEFWRKDVNAPKARLMGHGRRVMGRRKDGTMFPAMVLLRGFCAVERDLGLAIVTDLTGVLLHGANDGGLSEVGAPEGLRSGSEPRPDDLHKDSDSADRQGGGAVDGSDERGA